VSASIDNARGNGLPRERPVLLALLSLVVAACAWISIDLTRVAGSVASVWIANGIVVGLLLFAPWARWPAMVACALGGELAARLLHGDPVGGSINNALANSLEILLVAGAIRRRVPDITDASRLLDLAATATLSTLVACGVSASLAATYNALVAGGAFGDVLLTWYTAHAIGMVVVATLVVVARRERGALLGRDGRQADFAACMALLLAMCALVFGQDRMPLLFLLFPPLLMLTFRHGFAGVVSGVTVLAITSGVATALGAGPFGLVRDAALLERTLLLQLFVATSCVISLPVATAMSERRRLSSQLRGSEARYRILADYSRDLVLRMSADGVNSYVSPALTPMLGWAPADFARPRWDLVHPDDVQEAAGLVRRLFADGGSATVTMRVRHQDGHYVWVEAIATRIETNAPGATPEIVASCRDISQRMAARAALDESRARLRAVADNLPALVAYVDAEERYTFVNAHYERLFGVRAEDLLGKTVFEARGEGAYRGWAPYIAAALRGEEQIFERAPDAATGQTRYLQSHYVPDIGPDGAPRGFYALTFDITPLKEAERALERLARVDTLTGLGNRRQFDERLELAVVRARRHGTPLVLMSLDLDRFKQINDTWGHPAGDAVLVAFAERLKACVYDVDAVARLGGDEFVVLIEDAATPQVAELVAQKILTAMEAPVLLDGSPLQVATSIGIAYATSVASGRALIALADKALYDAKTAGRNTYRMIED
jgi:diguanylate cyclase (GGDEF)-like protein/PAS domain S-box-containing protein